MKKLEKPTVTKSDLIQKLNENPNYRNNAELMVNVFFGSISQALAKNNRVEIRGLGVFLNKYYKGYKGMNPKTREPVIVQSKMLPLFKPSKILKDFLNQ